MDCLSYRWLMFFLIYTLGFQVCIAATPLPSPVGRVVWVKGHLKAVMANKEERLLQRKSIIYLHDTLITDAKSQAQIGFVDQTLMTFRENTRFEVSKFNYNKAAEKTGKSVMNLIEGGFRTITGAVASNHPDNYAVNTPVATIGVRGTEYQIYFHKFQLYVGFYHGRVCITGGKSNGKDCSSDKKNKQSNISKTVCLSKEHPYAYVNGPCSNPQFLAKKPSTLGKDLLVVHENIEPFELPPPPPSEGLRSGTVSSFCIR